MSISKQTRTEAGEALERDAEALHGALSGLVRLYQFREPPKHHEREFQ